ncbi:MAG: hypothetical protein P9L99_17485 [Candidatus Lernaella stagnicola]|nr:hypothetical protein [Candidatus Lernaella stagnicola]
MRRILCWLLILMLALAAAACERPPKERSVAWQAPAGQWRVDAADGKRDVSFTITNEGPADAQLTRLYAAGEPDFSSVQHFRDSLGVAEKRPDEIAALLVDLVFRHMKSGRRTAALKEVEDDPLKAMAMIGEGEPEDLARTLALLAQVCGIKSRLLNLDRHFATVLQWDEVWHLADPTFGFIFYDKETRQYPSLSELALRMPLVKRNMSEAPRWKGKGDVTELYQWYLQQSLQNRLVDLSGANDSIAPWPLPAGAELTFELGGQGTREGVWRFTKQDDWSGRIPDFISVEGLTPRLYGFGPEKAGMPGTLRLEINLPFPVRRVSFTMNGKLPEGAGPRIEVFIMAPGQGPGDPKRVFDDDTDYTKPLRVEYEFDRGMYGPVRVEVRLLPAAMFITGIEWELGFLHGSAAAPLVAGRVAPVAAEAQSEGEAKLVAVHRWR